MGTRILESLPPSTNIKYPNSENGEKGKFPLLVVKMVIFFHGRKCLKVLLRGRKICMAPPKKFLWLPLGEKLTKKFIGPPPSQTTRAHLCPAPFVVVVVDVVVVVVVEC